MPTVMHDFGLQGSGESQLWHPIASDKAAWDGPVSVTLLGIALVLWRDAAGQAHVWRDQCPHRGARLSLGQVVQGSLQCPYHGWQFAPGGQCAHIPAVPDGVAPRNSSVTAYSCQESRGLIWVKLTSDAVGDGVGGLPDFPAESDATLRKLNCGPYWVDTSAGRLIENFLDMAHFGFVHEGWLGDATHTQIAPYQLVQEGQMLRAIGCKAWQPKSNRHSAQGAWVDYTYQLDHPFAAVLTKVPEPGSQPLAAYREAIALYVCPVLPEKSLAWFRLAVADFESSDAQLQAFQDTIFLQDQPIVESQVPKCLPIVPGREAHSASDKLSVAYRRYLQQLNIQFGVIRE